jgi:hypothetical protein
MRARRPWPSGGDAALLAASMALALTLASCGQPQGSGSGTGNPACDLITQEIAATVEPGLRALPNSPAKPPGSKAYVCGYSSKGERGMGNLSVALTSPASQGEIGDAKKTPDCAPVAGIGDFACLQWTGYFLGEAGGASANTILTAVKGKEVLDFRYLATPPISEGIPVPDGNASAKALAQALVDAGWGNGSALSVPVAPAVGSPTTTNNPVCAVVTADEVKAAFGATTTPQILPGEVSCRYTFGALGTPGPDSLIFATEVLKGAADGFDALRGEKVDGVGDRASVVVGTTPAGPKSLRPAGDVPITIISLQAVRGQNLATFVAQVLISPDGPTVEQTKAQLIDLVRGAEF